MWCGIAPGSAASPDGGIGAIGGQLTRSEATIILHRDQDTQPPCVTILIGSGLNGVPLILDRLVHRLFDRGKSISVTTVSR